MSDKSKVMLYLPDDLMHDLDERILKNKKEKGNKEVSRSAIISELVLRYLKVRGGLPYIIKKAKRK